MSGVPTPPARTQRAVPWFVWVGLALVVFGLALLFPPSGDDWRRITFADRTPSGLYEVTRNYYTQHNGRVLGNLTSYLLIEPVWLRALVKSVVVVGLVAALHRTSGNRTVWGVLLCFAGVFLVSAPVFRQSYGWSAGFFNYVPPMVGVVLLVGTLAGRWPRRTDSRPMAAVCAVLGAATCLFVEHVTVAVLVVALAAVALAFVGGGRPQPALWGWGAGVVVGATVMLASPGLWTSASGDDAYRGADGDLVSTVVQNYATITSLFVLSAPVILALVVITCLWHGVPGLLGSKGVGPVDVFVVAGTLVVGGYAALRRAVLADRLVCGEEGMADCRLGMLAVDLVMLVLLLAVLVATGPRVLPFRQDRAAWTGLLAATVLMLGPLLVVQPIGPRNLYGPLVTVVGMLAITARPWLEAQVPVARLLRLGLAAGVVVGLVWVTVIQAANARVAADRASILEDAVAERRTEVTLPAFPHPEWVHGPRDTKMDRRYFIEERGDITFRFEEE